MRPGLSEMAPFTPSDRSVPMVHRRPPASEPPMARPLAPPPTRAGHGPRPVVLGLVGVVLASAVLGSLAWRLSGGGEYTIATASMCPEMCVGTLVLDRPLVGPVRPGMVVTFRPPGMSTLYTHRVVKVLPDGSFKTAGDALGRTDPWTVPRDRVVGRVVGHVGALGWLWQCLPEMTAALACYLVARRPIRRSVRPHLDLLFVVVLVAVPMLTVRPLLRATVIAIGERGQRVVLRVANTGLLPARLALGGVPGPGHLSPGHLATLTASTSSPIWLRETVSFSAWQWALAALVLALPVLILMARLLWARRRGTRSAGAGGVPILGPVAPVPARGNEGRPTPTATLTGHGQDQASRARAGGLGPRRRRAAAPAPPASGPGGLRLLAPGAEGPRTGRSA